MDLILRVTILMSFVVGILVMVSLIPFIYFISQYPKAEAIKRYKSLMLTGKIEKAEKGETE